MIGVVRILSSVRADEYGRLSSEGFSDQFVQCGSRSLVEPAVGLVEDNEIRRCQESLCNEDFLSVALREGFPGHV